MDCLIDNSVVCVFYFYDLWFVWGVNWIYLTVLGVYQNWDYRVFSIFVRPLYASLIMFILVFFWHDWKFSTCDGDRSVERPHPEYECLIHRDAIAVDYVVPFPNANCLFYVHELHMLIYDSLCSLIIKTRPTDDTTHFLSSSISSQFNKSSSVHISLFWSQNNNEIVGFALQTIPGTPQSPSLAPGRSCSNLIQVRP